MSAVRLTAAAVALVAGLAVAARAADTDKDKLVGTWETVKSEDLPKGAKVEFTKDSKIKLTIEMGKDKISLDGTYKLDGKNLTVTLKGPDGKEMTDKMTIEELTATKLVTKDSKGKLDEFKKVPAK